MSFEFISSAEQVARQQQTWGTVFVVAGIGIAFWLFRNKPASWALAGIVLVAVGGYFFYQSWQLSSSGGEWVIRIDDSRIDWQSPNQQLDASFTIDLADIAYIDRSAQQSMGDDRPAFHIINHDNANIPLSTTSGINLDDFVLHLESLGIEVKETGNFYPRAELRNK